MVYTIAPALKVSLETDVHAQISMNCAVDAHDCDANATCANTVGSFNCACKSRFTGNGTTCVDIDECKLGVDDCSVNGCCTNTIGSFLCRCTKGSKGNGTVLHRY